MVYDNLLKTSLLQKKYTFVGYVKTAKLIGKFT